MSYGRILKKKNICICLYRLNVLKLKIIEYWRKTNIFFSDLTKYCPIYNPYFVLEQQQIVYVKYYIITKFAFHIILLHLSHVFSIESIIYIMYKS
jgi:hypothetical protein